MLRCDRNFLDDVFVRDSLVRLRYRFSGRIHHTILTLRCRVRLRYQNGGSLSLTARTFRNTPLRVATELEHEE
jgi:hypothetical protein